MNNPAANRKTQSNSKKKALPFTRKKNFYFVAIGCATLVMFSVISMWVMGKELSEKSQKMNEVVGHVAKLEKKSIELQLQSDSLKQISSTLKEETTALKKQSLSDKEKIKNLEEKLSAQKMDNKSLQIENEKLKESNKDLTKKYRERRDALENQKRLNIIALSSDKTAVKTKSSKSSVAAIQTNNIEEKQNTQPTGVFDASFYTPQCKGCSGITKSGAKATPGVTIAVDTRYWKLGTKFYVEGFGVLIAQDTGGAIKGKNRVDICVSSKQEALNLGKKQLKYWVLESN